MPGVAAGGLIANLMNPGLDQQVAASITPNPSPLAQQDQSKVPPVPGAPSNPAPGQAPPQVTQPDPALMKTNELLMRAYNVQNAADSFNQGLQRMAAGYGTAQQQASKMAALGGQQGGGGQGYLDMVGKMQGIDAQQTSQTEHSRFMANVGVLAKSLFPNDPDAVAKAIEVSNNPEMLQQIGATMAGNMGVTTTQKDFNAAQTAQAQQVKTDHPDWSPAQIQAEVNRIVPPSLMLQGLGPLADQEYQQYAAGERAAGRQPMGPTAWAEKNKVSALSQETQTKQATDFKDNGIQDFDTAHQTLTQSQAQVDKLLSNMPATMKALQIPGLFTTSGAAATASALGIGVSDDIKQAAIASQQLIANLTGESLKTIKNLRNQREFTTLGIAATAGLNANNGEDGVRKALEAIKGKFSTADANAYAVAGKQIPNQYAGQADERYTSKTIDGRDNPYYTGATYEPADSSSGGGGGGSQPPVPNAKQAPDGHWYVPDTARPGKYLRVD